MENIVWIVVGVISLLLVTGSLTSFFYQKAEDDRLNSISIALNDLGAMCDRMCDLPTDSYVSMDVNLISNILLTAKKDSFCITHKDKVSCRRCACPMDNMVLNLTQAPFNNNVYKCFFLRGGNSLSVECRG